MSMFGYNDNPRSNGIDDYQANLESKLEQEVNQAFARGLIDEDTWRDAVERGAEGPNLVQRVMFDHLPAAMGHTVTSQHTSSHGGILETFGDVLSFSNYMVAAFSSEATEAAKAKETGLGAAAPGVIGAAAGAAVGTAVAPGVGSLVGAGLGAVAGTFLDPDFSYSGLWEAYRNKQDFMKFSDQHELFGEEGSWANVAGGFVMDVTLDPLTYVTFGVKPGARVALTKGMKAGAAGKKGVKNLLASEATDLSLTNFGKTIYDLAAQDLMPKFRAQVQEGHILDGPISAAWHNEIAEYAVTHFDDLAEKMLKGDAQKKARILKMPRQKAREFINRATNPGYTVDDMFNETASAWSRDRGFNLTAGQKIMAGKMGIGAFGKEMTLPKPISGFFSGFFDRFDKGWDAAPEVVEQMKLANFAVESQLNASIEKYQTVFGHMPKKDRELVASLVESRYGAAASGYWTPSAANKQSDEIEAAVEFVRQEMDEILEYERVNNFATQNVDAYISHAYSFKPTQKKYYRDVIRRNGVENPSAANRFTQQRLIATIAEGREVFGEEALLTDAYEILAYRKRMSVEMVEKQKLFKWIAENHGIPTLLIQSQKERMPGGVLRAWMRRYSQGHAEVLDIDQMWTAEMGNLKRLGFIKGDHKHNVDLMKYLMRPNTAEEGGKLSAEGLAHGEALGVNERAKWWGYDGKTETVKVAGIQTEALGSKALDETFRWSPVRGIESFIPQRPTSRVTDSAELAGRVDDPGLLTKPRKVDYAKWNEITERSLKSQEGINYPIVEGIAMLSDPTHVGWKQVFRATEFGKAGEIERAAGFLSSMDRYLRKNLDANIVGFTGSKIGDVVLDAFQHHFPGGKLQKNDPDSATELLEMLDSVLGSNVEVRKLVPQVSPTLIRMAKATKEAVGIDTHRIPVRPDQLSELYESGIRLGFDYDTFQQLAQVTFGKNGITTVHEADVILDMFRALDPDGPESIAKEILRGTGEGGKRFAGDNVVKRTFVFPRKETDNVIPELLDQDLGIPTGTAGALSGSAAGEAIRKSHKADVAAGKVPEESADLFDVNGLSTGVSKKGPLELKIERQKNNISKAQIDHQQKIREMRHAQVGDDMIKMDARMTSLRRLARAIREADPESKMGSIIKRQQDAVNRLTNIDQKIEAAREAGDRIALMRLGKQRKKIVGQVEKLIDRLNKVRAEGNKGRRSQEQIFADIKRLAESAGLGDLANSLEEFNPEVYKEAEKIVKSTMRTTRRWWNKKNYKKRWPEFKADRAAAEAAEKKLLALEDGLKDLEKQLETGPDRLFKEGGGISQGKVVGNNAAQAATRTDSDELLRLRRDVGELAQRAEAGEDVAEQLAFARERLAEATENQLRYAREGVATRVPDRYTGGMRPDTGSVDIEVALPESVAKLVDQFMTPDIDPKLQGFARDMLRKYDSLQGFFKANLLLPWGGYWMRNVVSNAVLGYMGVGLRMFAPGEQNFRDAWWNTLMYTMHKNTDMTKMFGYEGIDEVFENLGKMTFTSKNGRTITVKELSEQMHMRGVYKGMISGDVMDSLTMGKRVEGAVTGAAAGAAVGTAIGASGDVLSEQLGGAETEGASVGGVMGAVAGGILGGRSPGRSWANVWDEVLGEKLGKTLRESKAGIPTPGIDKATGLLQSRWKPFLRAGEHASETPFRIATYISEFLDTGSNYSAMQKTNEALNDWNGLSVFERRIMRRIMPFYAWTKFAVQHTFRTTVEQPGRHANLMKAFRDWNAGVDADPEDVPDFLSEKLVMLADKDSPFVGMFIEDESASAITGFGAPIEDVAALGKALNPFGRGDQAKEFRTGILSRTAFGVGSVVEGVFNEDLFTGREIVSSGEVSAFQNGKKWADAPSYLKAIVGYRPATADSKEIVDPKIAWILGEVPVSRFIALAKQIHEMDDSDRKKMNAYTLSKSFLGASVYKLDPETNQYFVNKARIEALVSVLSRVGAIKKLEWYSDINKEDDKRQSSRIGGRGSMFGKLRRIE